MPRQEPVFQPGFPKRAFNFTESDKSGKAQLAKWLAQKPLPADNLIKYKKKKYSEKQHLVNSRYELKQQDNKFCGDISTLFQSHYQTRISYLQTCYHTIYKETGRDDVSETLHY